MGSVKNPKGLLNGTLSHPFGTPWRVQVCSHYKRLQPCCCFSCCSWRYHHLTKHSSASILAEIPLACWRGRRGTTQVEMEMNQNRHLERSTLIWVQQRMFCEQWMSVEEWMLAEHKYEIHIRKYHFFWDQKHKVLPTKFYFIYIYIARLNDLPSFQFSVTYFNGEKGVPSCGVTLFGISRGVFCPHPHNETLT